MNIARATLHVSAGFFAAVATIGFMLWLGGVPDGIGLTLLASIVASQIGALAGWPLIERRLRSDWLGPLGAGLMMAIIVHVATGVLWIPVTMLTGKPPADPGDALELALFITCYSAIFVGWITAPVAMITAVVVNRLRRKELAAGSAA